MDDEGGGLARVAAAVLIPILLAAAVAVLIPLVLIGRGVAGSSGAVIAFVVWEVALLVFLTLRAYPPGVKPPWIWFLILTILFSALIPAVYLIWVWLRRSKWPRPAYASEIPPSLP